MHYDLVKKHFLLFLVYLRFKSFVIFIFQSTALKFLGTAVTGHLPNPSHILVNLRSIIELRTAPKYFKYFNLVVVR